MKENDCRGLPGVAGAWGAEETCYHSCWSEDLCQLAHVESREWGGPSRAKQSIASSGARPPGRPENARRRPVLERGGTAGQGLDCSPGREERGPGRKGAAPSLALGAACCRTLGIHAVFGVCPARPTERRCYHLPKGLAHFLVCSRCDRCFPKSRPHGRKPSSGVASTNQIRSSCGTSIKSEVRITL